MGISNEAVAQLKKLRASLEEQQPEPNRILTVEERLTNFENRKITFNLMSKNEAKEFLTNNTYLYKISFYKDNFYTNNKREFLDLDFAYLRELSTIDMHIRYTFLKLCLDIEHGIKTFILSYFNNKNPKEGYSIIDRYIQSKFDKKNNSKTKKEIKLELLEYAKFSNHHLYHLYYETENNLENKINIWELTECVSLNELIEFYIFFRKAEIDKQENTSYKSILFAFRHVRNICAHNSPFLIDLNKRIKPNKILKNILDPRIELTNQKIADIASLFYLYNEVVTSKGMRDNRKIELLDLIERVGRKKEYYEKSYAKKVLSSIKSLFDIFFDK